MIYSGTQYSILPLEKHVSFIVVLAICNWLVQVQVEMLRPSTEQMRGILVSRPRCFGPRFKH